MSQNELSAVLAALPRLSRVELEAVIGAATALKAAPQRRPKQAKPAKQVKPARAVGEEKALGAEQAKPAKVDSIYKDVQEYINFKKADKALHKLLKEYKTDLKSVESFFNGNGQAIKSLAASDEKVHEAAMEKIDPILKEFRTAQEAWFRRKTELAAGNDTVAAENSSAQGSPPTGNPSGGGSGA
jgi:hypothetical protein